MIVTRRKVAAKTLDSGTSGIVSKDAVPQPQPSCSTATMPLSTNEWNNNYYGEHVATATAVSTDVVNVDDNIRQTMVPICQHHHHHHHHHCCIDGGAVDGDGVNGP